jgi:hypothetical protein
MDQITLNQAEQIICKFLAKQKNDSNHNSGVIDGKITDKATSYEINLEGVASEFAFCKKFNLYPDFSIGPRSGGYDCLSHKNTRIDVKSCKYLTNTYLLVKKTTKRNQADIYVLMVGQFPSYHYAGYATHDEVFQDKNLKDFGYPGKECYAIPATNLHEPKR